MDIKVPSGGKHHIFSITFHSIINYLIQIFCFVFPLLAQVTEDLRVFTPPAEQPKYQLNLLKSLKKAKAFDDAFIKIVQQYPVLSQSYHENADIPVNDFCDALNEAITAVAKEQLIPSQPLKKITKRLQGRKEMYSLVYQKQRLRRIDTSRCYNALSDFPAHQRAVVSELVIATRQYEKSLREKNLEEVEHVLRDMSATSHINVRLDMCFKFLRARKRSTQFSAKTVTHSSLELEIN